MTPEISAMDLNEVRSRTVEVQAGYYQLHFVMLYSRRSAHKFIVLGP